MDAKITKKRLSHMLSYDWIKILLSVVAAIAVWAIIFTSTATRITSTQRFVVCNYRGVNYGNKLSLYGGFSHEILEGEAVDLLRGGEDNFYDLFTGNISIGEGDLMMVANAPSSKTAKKDDNGNELKNDQGETIYEYGISYMDSALASFYGHADFSFTRLDDDKDSTQKGFFTQMNEYLGRFYPVLSEEEKTFNDVALTVKTFDADSLNKQAVKTEFRARVKKNKDKRYKTEAQLQEGEKYELERISSYLAAYNTFFENLEDGKIALTALSVDIRFSETTTKTISGAYGINLCPDEATMGNLKDLFYYVDTEDVITAKNMNVMFLTMKDLDPDFQYENLIYINSIVKNVYVGA